MANEQLVVALLIGPWALGGCATNENRATAAPTAQAEQTEQPAVAESPQLSAMQTAAAIEELPQPDRDFLKQAASTNLAAIRFGELAANSGNTVEVRSLGREMVDTHTALSDQMRISAHTEGVTLPAAQLTARQQRMYDELSKLSGPQFDDAFTRDVVKLQKETIASFQNEAVHGRLSELAMLANQTLPVLNQRARTVRNQLGRM
jgi:putative membrane protein